MNSQMLDNNYGTEVVLEFQIRLLYVVNLDLKDVWDCLSKWLCAYFDANKQFLVLDKICISAYFYTEISQ